MTPTVTVDQATKTRLAELTAEIRVLTGEDVSEQAVLRRLVVDAYESKSEFVDSFRETTVPLSQAEKEAVARGTFSSGVETEEEDIDDILYG